ncbi:hypothetical protein B0H16DRAFT_466734 [Mycena metata]|uniref:Secreted protein n=1 Tax=Mycena metata TaxID=1033252 RepID=A0AAD7KCG7_9AGAR|nr:hypothetical protein B0H16DRAFT_466734 [Mycena metata]
MLHVVLNVGGHSCLLLRAAVAAHAHHDYVDRRHTLLEEGAIQDMPPTLYGRFSFQSSLARCFTRRSSYLHAENARHSSITSGTPADPSCPRYLYAHR